VRLRTRVSIGLSSVVFTVAITSVFVARSQWGFQIDQVDRQLESAIPIAERTADPSPARDVPAVVPIAPVAPVGGAGGGPAGGPGANAFSELYVGTLDSDGALTPLFSSELVDGAPVLGVDDLARMSAPGTFAPFVVDGSGADERFRVALLEPRDPTIAATVVAVPLTRADDAQRRLMIGLALATAFVAAIAALTGWWVLRLGVRPINDMTAAADAITAGDTHRRVRGYPERTEAGRLAKALNTMLDERQRSDDRLRRFVADASHELRTPLTSIRGYTELYSRGALRDPAQLADAMGRVSSEANRMGLLVDDLLLLSRFDGDAPLHLGPVDLGVVVRDAAADALAVQPARPVIVDAPEHLVVDGDDARLRQVVGVLVHNALVHTPADSSITIELSTEPAAIGPAHAASSGELTETRSARACIVVVDDGPGIDPETAAVVFERFVRGDPSRSRHGGGSGLGLSIAESIVTAHRGTISLDTQPGAGCRFRVELPISASSVPTVP
jgi:two-component system, OmpR family, sensor kinase